MAGLNVSAHDSARSRQCGHGFDEANLLAATPALDFFFAADCCLGIEEAFVINEAGEIVPAGESGHEFVLVFEHAAVQIAGDTRVENV